MRSTADDVTVRLYHLDECDGARTLMYGPLADALAMARAQPEEVRAGLYLQTDNDVIAISELEGE